MKYSYRKITATIEIYFDAENFTEEAAMVETIKKVPVLSADAHVRTVAVETIEEED